ncbi:Protein of unknown function DUF2343 [Macleaya cordata]|uniref:Uncharacterized protein n=1 Tax=Macleaya cordata TaxID=56857 RepID=A0A200QLC7_MACCD|nr:Protein of unknown function DUF2343 [Macleaya cordata]
MVMVVVEAVVEAMVAVEWGWWWRIEMEMAMVEGVGFLCLTSSNQIAFISVSLDRSIDRSVSESESSRPPPKLKDLWKKISSNEKPMNENAELVVDFFSNKMNRAWKGLENAPDGSFKNKIYGLGMRLLAGVKPSEIFLKSISKEVTNVEVAYPTGLNPRLVRRRLRHIAFRGAIIHRRYFYGSVTLLPLTTAFAVLPLPNIPFFWILFRTYSHWRALQGSERLLVLVSDSSRTQNLASANENGKGHVNDDSEHECLNSPGPPWILRPSEDLEEYLRGLDEENGLSKSAVSDICKAYHLDAKEVLKYRNSM